MKKSINKKIKNATPTTFNNINFKSELEVKVYKLLSEAGFMPSYESNKYILSAEKYPRAPFYIGTKGSLLLNTKKLSPITYTPDFTFMYNDMLIIIEVKGIANDVYPLKRNLFRKLLEEIYTDIPVLYFEIKTKKELMQAISIIKSESLCKINLRGYLSFLPDKYYSKALKMLEEKKYSKLQKLVDKLMKDDFNYQNINTALNELKNEETTV